MTDPTVAALLALIGGGAAGYFIARTISAGRIQSFENQLETVTRECVTLRQKAQDGAVAEASFMAVGNSLENAQSTFEKAKGQLHTGRGNLMLLAERMASLGVESPGGELPKLILKANEEDERAEVISMSLVGTSAD